MQYRPLIAVDVDLTIVDTYNPWITWFNNKLQAHGHPKFAVPPGNAYKVGYAMAEHAKSVHMRSSPYDFWRDRFLYQDKFPLSPLIKPTLSKWQEMGADIVFVSQCDPDHYLSKHMFLQKHFGGDLVYSFISAHGSDKWMIDFDAIVDDHCENIIKCTEKRPDAVSVLYNQFNGENYQPQGVLHTANDWAQVDPIISRVIAERSM